MTGGYYLALLIGGALSAFGIIRSGVVGSVSACLGGAILGRLSMRAWLRSAQARSVIRNAYLLARRTGEGRMGAALYSFQVWRLG